MKWWPVLLCVFLGTTYFTLKRDSTRVGVRELVLPKFDPQAVDEIHTNGVILKNLNTEYAKLLLDAAAHIQIDHFVTERESSPMSKVALLSHGKIVWQLLIGDEVEGGRLVCLPNSKSIFVATGKFSNLLRERASDWEAH